MQYLRHRAPIPFHSPSPPSRALRDTVFPFRLIGNSKFLSHLEIRGITRFTSTQPTAPEPQPAISSFRSDRKFPSGFHFDRQLHRPGGASVSEGPSAAMAARHLPPPSPIVVDSIAAGTSHIPCSCRVFFAHRDVYLRASVVECGVKRRFSRVRRTSRSNAHPPNAASSRNPLIHNRTSDFSRKLSGLDLASLKLPRPHAAEHRKLSAW